MNRRPAETTAAASAVAVLIVKLLGVDDPDILVALTVVVGLVPGIVTGLVNRFWPIRHPPHA